MTTTTSTPVLTSTAVAARLTAGRPAWTATCDVLVVGSGVAGLSVVAGLAGSGLDVMLVTKGALDAGSTPWAQGGVARATSDPGDTEAHAQDTMVAGAGLCDPVAVRRLAAEGPAAVEALIARGAAFDLGPDGRLAQTREGGHSRARIIHAGGDATGAEVQRALTAVLTGALADDRTTIVEHTYLLDLERSDDGQVTGALVARASRGLGRRMSVGRILARATVVATGGLGRVFGATTNPPAVTGDGMAAALRAGAALRDVEFVQFHPTVFAGPTMDTGQALLISEAVRGEGAVLRDTYGEAVMAGVHPLADLAPRDIVAARLAQVMAAQGVDHLFLDARHLGAQVLEHRFPTVVAGCRAAGVDPVTQPIPIRPAQHYSCGGVAADLDGRTAVPGLSAVGEVACTGVHGANRLASNSLLEGLVAGSAAARVLREDLPRRTLGAVVGTPASTDPSTRATVASAMQADAGVLRSPQGLADLASLLDRTAPTPGGTPTVAAWESTNLHAISTALVAAACARTESRGCHRRTDVTDPSLTWAVHLDTTIGPDHSLESRITPV
ncbi:MAG: L-aspartate oxidase [Micrococcales bacterium]|nr:L-aspartate oxidase [Micrococcales bacterium]